MLHVVTSYMLSIETEIMSHVQTFKIFLYWMQKSSNKHRIAIKLSESTHVTYLSLLSTYSKYFDVMEAVSAWCQSVSVTNFTGRWKLPQAQQWRLVCSRAHVNNTVTLTFNTMVVPKSVPDQVSWKNAKTKTNIVELCNCFFLFTDSLKIKCES